jgi:cytoskeletal protein CcmA (bactofilin family)
MAESDTTIIGRDATIKGEISFASPARVLGNIEGKIIARAEMLIGESAVCKAAVHGSHIRVEGTIEGDVIATERAELTSKARVKGDLAAGALVVAEGATFVGHCRVGPDAVQAALKESGISVAGAAPALRLEKPVIVETTPEASRQRPRDWAPPAPPSFPATTPAVATSTPVWGTATANGA